jgi:Demethylmenaquinone methyltransferase
MDTAKIRIIQYLENNRVSTEEIADILGKTGVIKGAYPINNDQYIVGEIQYVYAYNNSNWPVHEQLRDLQPGRVVFVDTIFVDDEHAVFGELVSSFIMENRKAKAIIINGAMRDFDGIRKRKYPVWCKGITPIGCFNVQPNRNAEINRQAKAGIDYYDGAIAVCDASGVVVIPKSEINDEFISKMDNMVEQERIWFECVEKRGWNTFDTVCLKKYKEQNV